MSGEAAVQPAGEVEVRGPVFCPSCNANTWPYQEQADGADAQGDAVVGMGRMVDHCGKCHAILGTHGIGRTSTKVSVPVQPLNVVPGIAMTPPTVEQPWTIPAAPAPSDFLWKCGVRLQIIELELVRMAGLQAEAKQLRKLLGKGANR